MPGVTGSFVVADYVVFAMLLVLSAAIGVYTGWTARGQGGAGHFLTGSRKLTALPVSASLITTFMSSVTLLTNPVEVYQYGAIFGLLSISYIVAIVVSSEIFLPFFYRLNITSVYEYLELRFNRTIRLLGTLLFIAQAILLNGLIIYAPALALNQGRLCLLTAVSHSHGLRQFSLLFCLYRGWYGSVGLMLAGNLSVIIKAVMLQGGVGTIWSDAQQGGRINLWDFDPNPQRRNTFWTLTIGGAFGWTTTYGTNQAQVQTYISCKSVTHARVALYINLLGLMAVLLSSVFAGLCLYSVYKSCDPHTAGLVSASDQLMPYLVMDILTGYPGLPGLYFAAVYSGTLSTVSCTINSLAAVTLEDLIKPFTSLSAKQLSILSKGLSKWFILVYHIYAACYMNDLYSLFILWLRHSLLFDVLVVYVFLQGCLSGLVSGVMASVCVILGALVSTPTPEMTRPLPLTTEGCNFTTSLNSTFTALPTQLAPFTTSYSAKHVNNIHRGLDGWHSISYLYYGVIGTLVALIVGIIVSLLTGHREKVDPTLTLKREDTLSYHLFKFLKEKVSAAGGRKH
uniref:Sodium-coupled monocarboxylate transporter 1-like n=1 Tax=Stegastes partitus TaxID=144197 RepID=A0A3B5APP4_9TELE